MDDVTSTIPSLISIGLLLTILALGAYEVYLWLSRKRRNTKISSSLSVILKTFLVGFVIALLLVPEFTSYKLSPPRIIFPDSILGIDDYPKFTFEELVKGKIAYSVKEKMTVGSHYQAAASITKALNDSILFLGLPDTSSFSSEQIMVSSRVKLALIDPIGERFTIKPLTTEEQHIDAVSNTVWMWNVSPMVGGESELILRATVKRFDENHPSSSVEKDVLVFQKTIVVKSSFSAAAGKFIAEYWQWLGTVIVLPFLIWVFGYVKGKINNKKKKGKPIGFKPPGK